jgi:hypothetical protein
MLQETGTAADRVAMLHKLNISLCQHLLNNQEQKTLQTNLQKNKTVVNLGKRAGRRAIFSMETLAAYTQQIRRLLYENLVRQDYDINDQIN